MRFFLIIVCLYPYNCILLNAQAKSRFSTTKRVIIKVHVERANPIDTFRLSIYDFFFNEGSPTRTIIAKRDNSGDYAFSFELQQPCYISLFKDFSELGIPKYLFRLYLVEPGDCVDLQIEKKTESLKEIEDYQPEYTLFFWGKGGEKYKCRLEIDTATFSTKITNDVINLKGEFVSNNFYDVKMSIGIKTLNKYKKKMSSIAYNILKVDLFTKFETQRLEHMTVFQSQYLKDSVAAEKISEIYKNKIDSTESHFTEYAKIISANYPQFILDKLSIGRYVGNMKQLKNNSIKPLLIKLKNTYSGELKDKVLVFFVLNSVRVGFQKEIVDSVLREVKTDYCRNELNSFSKYNSKGQPAYNFALSDTSGILITLDNFKRKVVFIDFWFTGCVPCAKYYREVLSKAEKKFKQSADVVFISINVDAERENWMKGIYQGVYTSPDIVNLNTGKKGVGHPVVTHYRVAGYPSLLLIDREGKIFSNDIMELRNRGVQGLNKVIDEALIVK